MNVDLEDWGTLLREPALDTSALQPAAAASALASPPWADATQWTQLQPDPAQRASFPHAMCEIHGIPTPQKSTPPSGQPSPPTEETALPELPVLLDLIDIYFDRIYQFVPVLHKQKLITAVKASDVTAAPDVLLFALAAIAARHHPDPRVRERKDSWFNEARTLIAKYMHSREQSLPTVQASTLIIYQATVDTEFSTVWIMLGEAWRKAVAIGWGQCDGSEGIRMPAMGIDVPMSWIEMEEIRRVVWVLYLNDRGVCSTVGLEHAIDDRRLRVNLPMADDLFQDSSANSDEPANMDPIQYSQDIGRFITSVQTKCRKKTATTFQLIILSYVLLGRITELLHSLDFDYDEQEPQLQVYIDHLVRMRLMLPYSAADIAGARSEDFAHVVWLNLVMSICTIHLHHRALKEGETLQGQNTLSKLWPHCVSAGKATVAMIRDASRSSTSALMNAHISSFIFLSGRILVIEYFCPSNPASASGSEASLAVSTKSRDPQLRRDLETVLMVLTHMRDSMNNVGQKFYKGFVFWLQNGETIAPQGKALGSKRLLHTCERWPEVMEDDEVVIPP